jgi:hypothetical protein
MVMVTQADISPGITSILFTLQPLGYTQHPCTHVNDGERWAVAKQPREGQSLLFAYGQAVSPVLHRMQAPWSRQQVRQPHVTQQLLQHN